VERLVGSIPREWQVPDPLRVQLIDLLVRRAGFVAEHFEGAIRPLLVTG
jgi:hypothetical protein